MDMRQFAGSSFITVETLRDGPREEVIVSVAPGKYDKPVATFESGDQLSLNATNVNTLIKAYGPNDQDWVGCTDRARTSAPRNTTAMTSKASWCGRSARRSRPRRASRCRRRRRR